MAEEVHNLKAEGNLYYEAGNWEKAKEYYNKALKACPSEDKITLAALLKNMAAVSLKLEDYVAAENQASQALECAPNDPKALYRRSTARSYLSKYSEALTDAKRALHYEPDNKAIIKQFQDLNIMIQKNAEKLGSTEAKLQDMLKICFSVEATLENRIQALHNIMVLVGYDDGARLFTECGGLARLMKLIDDESNTDLLLAAFRVLIELATSEERLGFLFKVADSKTIVYLLNCSDNRCCQAAMALVQRCFNTLSAMDFQKQKLPDEIVVERNKVKIVGFLFELKRILVDPTVSAMGRDCAIQLLSKILPHRVGGLPKGWSLEFVQNDGLDRLMTVGCSIPERALVPVTYETRDYLALCLTNIYDDMLSDKNRNMYTDRMEKFIQEKREKITDGVKIEICSLFTTLLGGPVDVAFQFVAKPEFTQLLLEMAASDDQLNQSVAVEAIMHTVSKRDRCSVFLAQGKSVLKKLFNSSNDVVRVKALVGLCKISSSGGNDISMRPTGELSMLRLANICKRYLLENKSIDICRWAAEGLAYLTLDADVKEWLVSDVNLIRRLVAFAKQAGQLCVFGVSTILVNLTNTYDKKEPEPELIELAKFAKHHIPVANPKDSDEYVQNRIKLLVNEGAVSACVALSSTESERCREFLARALHGFTKEPQHRGIVVQEGGVKLLIDLAQRCTEEGKIIAAHALARIGITMDPKMAFSGQRCYEVVKPIISLLHPDMSAEQNYEALLALTNLAAVSDSVRNKMIQENVLPKLEEFWFLQEHEPLRAASAELFHNLLLNDKIFEQVAKPGTDRLKLWLLYCSAEDDERLALISTSAMLMLTQDAAVCSRIVQEHPNWPDLFKVPCMHENEQLQLNAIGCVKNLMNSGQEAAAQVVSSELFEILVAICKLPKSNREKAVSLAYETLKLAVAYDLVKPTSRELYEQLTGKPTMVEHRTPTVMFRLNEEAVVVITFLKYVDLSLECPLHLFTWVGCRSSLTLADHVLSTVLSKTTLKREAMNSFHRFAFSLPDKDLRLEQQLRDSMNSQALDAQSTFMFDMSPFRPEDMKDIVVGPDAIAFLTVDGQVFRVAYDIIDDTRDHVNKGNDNGKKDATGSGGGATGCSTVQASNTGRGSGGPNNNNAGSGGNNDSNAGISARATKIRRVMMARSRVGRGGVIVGSRPIIPAGAVPEELVNEAQAVLQGKSRDVIIRELQRTNCDVNQAVNNLLGRDDEDGDDFDDTSEAYLPEELISLLDTGLQGEQANVIINAESLYGDDFLSFPFRRRVFEKAAEKKTNDSASKESSNEESVPPPPRYTISLSPKKMFFKWTTNEESAAETKRFRAIGAMHSDLLAVSMDGVLYRWAWNQKQPSPNPHPAWETICNKEPVESISCSSIRTTVLTTHRRVASFVDESLDLISNALSTSLHSLPEPIVDVYSCDLYSCAMTKSGNVYWWGVLPSVQRMKVLDAIKNKLKKEVASDAKDITVGRLVRMQHGPMFQADALGFTVVNGYPQVVILMESVWPNHDTARFQMLLPSSSVLDPKRGLYNEGLESAVEDSSETFVSSAQLSAGNRKRKHALSAVSSYREETLHLKDVVMVVENRNATIGKVVKVDGPYCAVLFADSNGVINDTADDAMNRSRLLRKEDLRVVPKVQCFSSTLEYIQREPKKFYNLSDDHFVLDVAIESTGIWYLHQLLGRVLLSKINFSGEMLASIIVAYDSHEFIGSRRPRLINNGEDSLILIRDGCGSLTPVWTDLPARVGSPTGIGTVMALGYGTHTIASNFSEKKKIGIILLAEKKEELMRDILHCDVDYIKARLFSQKPMVTSRLYEDMLSLKLNCGRNVLHVAVSMSIAPTNKENFSLSLASQIAASENPAGSRPPSDGRWEAVNSPSRINVTVSLNSMMQLGRRFVDPTGMSSHVLRGYALRSDASTQSAASRWAMEMAVEAAAAAAGIVPAGGSSSTTAVTAQSSSSSSSTPTMAVDEEMMVPVSLDLSTLKPKALTSSIERQRAADHNGMTPFMYAIDCRSYHVAEIILLSLKRIIRSFSAQNQNRAMMSVVFPVNTRPEFSPLYMLCCNDTCSFTWTGSEHVNQDIFECITCGLVGSLCCCTECAYVCHRNHECRLKRTSPTAYCDCWEKCKCRSLVAGNLDIRFELFKSLISCQSLYSVLNDKNEHLLLFLTRTVSRQVSEHRQFRSRCRKSIASLIDMPEFDLDPPRFALRALEYLFSRWDLFEHFVMHEYHPVETNINMSESRFYLISQDGVSFLDRFVYLLLTKLPIGCFDSLVRLLSTECKATSKVDKNLAVLPRFARSVVRMFVLLNVSPQYSNCRKNQPLSRCRKVFHAILPHAVRELVTTADGILAPVRLGMVKPCEPFTMANCTDPLELIEKMVMEDPVLLPNDVDKEEEKKFGVDENDILSSSPIVVNSLPKRTRSEEVSYMQDLATLTGEEATSDNDTDSEVDEAMQEAEGNATAGSDAGNDDSSVDVAMSPLEAMPTLHVVEIPTEADSDHDGSQASGRHARRVSNADQDTDYSYTEVESNSSVSEESDVMFDENNQEDTDTEGSNFAWSGRVRDRKKGTKQTTSPEKLSTSTVHITNLLSRLFSTLIREALDLLLYGYSSEQSSIASRSSSTFYVPKRLLAELLEQVSRTLQPTWNWLFPLLDYLDSHLRFSAAMSNMVGPKKRQAAKSHMSDIAGEGDSTQTTADKSPIETSSKSETASRLTVLNLLMSVMRSHSSEHGDSWAVLDLWSMKHVAIVADAYFCYAGALSMFSENLCNSVRDMSKDFPASSCCDLLFIRALPRDSSDPIAGESTSISKQNPFFTRSDSMVYPGLFPVRSAFEHSVPESIPLCNRPHMLQASSSKESLYGLPASSDKWSEHLRSQLQMGNEAPGSSSLTRSMSHKTRLTLASFAPLDDSAADREIQKSSPKRFRRERRSKSVIVHSSEAASPKSAEDTIAAIVNSALVRCEDQQMLMSRWKLVLSTFAKIFTDEHVLTSGGSIFTQLAGFGPKAARFRKAMERIRNTSKDLQFMVDRDRPLLLRETFQVLNAFFERRQMGNSSQHHAIGVHRVKVSFKDEPGEGSGVARSFFTAIASALLAPLPLPNFELSPLPTTVLGMNTIGLGLRSRGRSKDNSRRPLFTMPVGWLEGTIGASPFFPTVSAPEVAGPLDENNVQAMGNRIYMKVNSMFPRYAAKVTGMLLEVPTHQLIVMLTHEATLEHLAQNAYEVLLTWVQSSGNLGDFMPGGPLTSASTTSTLMPSTVATAQPANNATVTTTIATASTASASVSASQVSSVAVSGAAAATTSMAAVDASSSAASSGGGSTSTVSPPAAGAAIQSTVSTYDSRWLSCPDLPRLLENVADVKDDRPLFFKPGNGMFYAPVAGAESPSRLNAYRNVGRLIGIALSQNEIFPLPLCRSVFKFILRRPITWYDMAFYDCYMYEKLHKLVTGEYAAEDLDLNFTITLDAIEGGNTVELLSDGANVTVTSENVVKYVFLYAQHRLYKLVQSALTSIRDGVRDVIPVSVLDTINAEDFRLLLTGQSDVNVKFLKKLTVITDESSSAAADKSLPREKFDQFKKWFWSVVSCMTADEKQDLIYFWTGSPTLPPTMEGFMPTPNVVIRPPDDMYLPTANTCISRLYIPLYSSKNILRQKLLFAIKIKTFGFNTVRKKNTGSEEEKI
ncbi:E3 ubiquitin-protein ligase UBR5 [Trichinella papuae]|uniref:Protein unc-45 homolog B n=1 Tax=Trichinella papuae TaxID=268474 RepID=A0A0V1ML71_9BILA|nr:E3 ubiquitin-protein ligase UBR5 [Trichinella papuae]